MEGTLAGAVDPSHLIYIHEAESEQEVGPSGKTTRVSPRNLLLPVRLQLLKASTTLLVCTTHWEQLAQTWSLWEDSHI